jgi:hypothetical protein
MSSKTPVPSSAKASSKSSIPISRDVPAPSSDPPSPQRRDDAESSARTPIEGRVSLSQVSLLLSTSQDRRLAALMPNIPRLEGVNFLQMCRELEEFSKCASEVGDVDALYDELRETKGLERLTRSDLLNFAESPLQINAGIAKMLLIPDSKTWDKPLDERTKLENKYFNRVSKADRKRLMETCERRRTVKRVKTEENV